MKQTETESEKEIETEIETETFNLSYQLHECLHFSNLFWKTDQPVVVDDEGLEWQLADRGRQVTQLIPAEKEKDQLVNTFIGINKRKK